VRITKSKEETTIFIGNIRKYWTENHVRQIITERVSYFDRMRFFADPNNPGRNRGYCFIEYDNPMLARDAYDKLSRNIVLDNTSLTIDWADEFDSNQDINKVQIHLSGINDSINTEELNTVFGQYGNIINIKLARDLENLGRTDYGFVTYSTEEEAARAIREFNWKEYFDSPVSVQYARKISAIIKHKQKTKGDMLDKKRRRDNIIKKSKEDDGSDIEENMDNSKIIKKQELILNV
jgi:RNA recognition motif-containing protein